MFSEMIAGHLSGKVLEEYEPCEWIVCVWVDAGMYPLLERCQRDGVKTLAYWIGSDVEFAHKWWDQFNLKFTAHAAVHERLKDELGKVGVNPDVVYFPVREEVEVANRGGTPLVAVYMPSVTGKYCWLECVEVAGNSPDIDFVFYGSDDLPELPSNCFDAGRMEPEEVTSVLRRATVLMRLTAHDGCPQGISEAKMLGKNVIANYPYRGCLLAKSTRDAIALVNDPATHEGCTEGREWYVDNCSPSAFRDRMAALMGKVRGNV